MVLSEKMTPPGPVALWAEFMRMVEPEVVLELLVPVVAVVVPEVLVPEAAPEDGLVPEVAPEELVMIWH